MKNRIKKKWGDQILRCLSTSYNCLIELQLSFSEGPSQWRHIINMMGCCEVGAETNKPCGRANTQGSLAQLKALHLVYLHSNKSAREGVQKNRSQGLRAFYLGYLLALGSAALDIQLLNLQGSGD